MGGVEVSVGSIHNVGLREYHTALGLEVLDDKLMANRSLQGQGCRKTYERTHQKEQTDKFFHCQSILLPRPRLMPGFQTGTQHGCPILRSLIVKGGRTL